MITISKQEYEKFMGEYGVNNLQTLNSQGAPSPISKLERNALECVFNAGMFVPKGEQYIVDEKMYALYFAIHHFMETGSHLEAFDLYCIYTNDKQGQLQNMMNFVASYENGAARLVQNHRDHYVHSAYVFVLGLAMFHTQSLYREAFDAVYSEKGAESYSKFIDLWGLTALFHDIGYQYEIPFNQIRENNKFDYGTGKKYIYFHYKNMDKYTELSNIFQGDSAQRINELVDNTFEPERIEDVFAYHIRRRLSGREGLEVTKIAEELHKKNEPEEKDGGVYMDHAYYSGIRLFKYLVDIYGASILGKIKKSNKVACWISFHDRMDAITAIVMHNKFFELCLSNGENMSMQEHPLAYLLILCDELQCWNRTSYGKSSLTQFHAKECEFEFGESRITANYVFDIKNDAVTFESNEKNDAVTFEIASVVSGPLKKFLINKDKKFIDVQKIGWVPGDCTTWRISSSVFKNNDVPKFLYSIHEIVDCSGSDRGIGIAVSACFSAKNQTYSREYLTTFGMEDLYKLAEEYYREYKRQEGKRGPIPEFGAYNRSIQDKLCDFMMVRSLGRILHAGRCFALKEQKAFDRIMSIGDFTPEEMSAMYEEMRKCHETFYRENYWVCKEDKQDRNNHLDILLETVLKYPGIEVYRL